MIECTRETMDPERAGLVVYGHDKTIHQTGEVDIEVDKAGKVVSVWFRCLILPFTQTVVGAERASEMRRLYTEHPPGMVHAVAVEAAR